MEADLNRVAQAIADVMATATERAGQAIDRESYGMFADNYHRESQALRNALIATGIFAALRAYSNRDLRQVYNGTFLLPTPNRPSTTLINQVAADRHRANFYFTRSLERMARTDIIAARIISDFNAGIARGESVHTLMRQIRTSTNANTWQARRTARTECLRSLSQGSYLAACQVQEELGLNIMKTWHHTAEQEHPRLNHQAMDGETVPLNEPFSNGGMFPQDPKLPADESINCQCAASYRVVP